jgi:membrane-bound inhibitor of C-type lysozyme
MEVVVALLMFVNFEIKEHRIQPSMSVCLKGKREAERTFSDTVQYKCIRAQAEVKTNNDGSRYITKIILN